MSLIIRLPNKLAQRVGLKHLETRPAAENPLQDWSVAFFAHGKEEYLLVANTTALYAELVPVTSEVTDNVEQAFFDAIERMYRDSPYRKNFTRYIQSERRLVVYAKAHSRSATGNLKQMAFEIGVTLDYGQTLEEINESIKERTCSFPDWTERGYDQASNLFVRINEHVRQKRVGKKDGQDDTLSIEESSTVEGTQTLELTPAPNKTKAKSKPIRKQPKATPKIRRGKDDDYPDFEEARRKGAATIRKMMQALESGAISPDQLNGFVDVNKIMASLPVTGPTADDLLDDAEAAEDPNQIKEIVEKALKLDPNSVRAYEILAHSYSKSLDKIKEYLLTGIKIGEALYPEGIQKEFDGNLWLLTEARPYLRLLAEMAWYERRVGDLNKACALYEKLLRYSEGDNLGMRYTLIFFLIELNRDDNAEKLYKHYDEDDSAQWLYARALLDYRKFGPTSEEALASLKKAKRANPHFAKICGSTVLFNSGKCPHSYSHGSEAEAYVLVCEGGEAIVATKGFREWCAKK